MISARAGTDGSDFLCSEQIILCLMADVVMADAAIWNDCWLPEVQCGYAVQECDARPNGASRADNDAQ